MSMDADKSGVKRRKLAAASTPMFVGMSDGVCPRAREISNPGRLQISSRYGYNESVTRV